jgi:hypothetical protein
MHLKMEQRLAFSVSSDVINTLASGQVMARLALPQFCGSWGESGELCYSSSVGEAEDNLGQAFPRSLRRAGIGEEVKGGGQNAEHCLGAVAGGAAGLFEKGPQALRERVLAQQQDDVVGERKPHQQAE